MGGGKNNNSVDEDEWLFVNFNASTALLMGKPKGPDPEELVLNYLNEKNRPFNTQMVVDGMHGGML